uniref:G_PROTEIN_RECEP_F1_2 domain-containing protein n=1 Tax=Caenorhabditis tropicalis TaxID=1561998 RepID=A0A1I7UAU2_9PELO
MKENSEKTAFNLICFFRAISNIIILTNVFVITFFPKTVLGYSPYPPVVESWLINIANTLYLGNEYQIVLVALNRFCALFFPMKYSRVFSVSNTTLVLILIYLYRIGKKIYELVPQSAKGCHALYSTEALAWSYDSSEQCDFVDDALEVILYTFIAMVILNTITFVKILHFYKKRNSNQDNETKKRMRKNTIHFVQTMLQDSLYLIDLTFTFKLSSWSTHRVWTYFSGTFIWECLHSTDGFIMVMFNERLSFLKKKITNSSVIPIVGGQQNLRRGTISASTIPSVKQN